MGPESPKVGVPMSDSNGQRRDATIREAADHFEVSVRTVRRWLKTTDIPFSRIGGPNGAVRFNLTELDRWAESHGAPARVAS